MKYILVCLIYVLFSLPSLAQDYEEIDSLKKLLQSQVADTSQANIRIRLAKTYWNFNSDSAMLYAREGLVWSEKAKDKALIASAYNTIGNIFMDMGKGKEAMEWVTKGLRLYTELGDEYQIYKTKYTLGYIYLSATNHEDALRYNLDCMNYFERVGDIELLPGIYHNVAASYLATGNKRQALVYSKKALMMNHKAGYLEWESRNLMQIASIYHYYDKNNKEALRYYKAARKDFCILGDRTLCSMSMVGIGASLANLGRFNEAMDTLQVALAEFRKLRDKNGVAWAYNHMGMCFTLQKKYHEAAVCLDSCLRLCKELNSTEAMRNVYERLYQLDSASGNFARAFIHYRLYIAARDSMINVDRVRDVSNQFMRFEFAKKEAQYQIEQDRKDSRQTNIRYAFFAGLITLGLFLALVYRQRNKLNTEKKRSDSLLLNMLPGEVADELKEKGKTNARSFAEVTILFTDFVDFTEISENLSPEALVNELNDCFSMFDHIIEKNGLEKIKTIGDAYMAVCGMPTENNNHAVLCARAAIHIVQFMKDRQTRQQTFDIRIGIHSGPVVAGIVGIKKFAYDVWGDTVNTAARMEQNSDAGRINISGTTYELIKHEFTCTNRGKIQVKGKGEMEMYFLEE